MSRTSNTVVAAAFLISTGGAVVIDRTQEAIPVECRLEEAPHQNLDRIIREYKVDKGFLATREMTSKDRATIKGCEIAKSVGSAVHHEDGLTIIIEEVEPIEGGVQAFVRAFEGQKQIGFGTDGSVDIERFRIYNPPVLVEDKNGPIIRSQSENPDLGIEAYAQAYREDPKEALIQSIRHTISVKTEVFGPEKIVQGKVGNTTSTFYPAAGSSSPVDGQINRSSADSTWQSYRDGAGTSAFDNLTTTVISYLRSSGTNINLMIRSYFLFNTAAIGTDTISSATVSWYVTATSNTSSHGGLSVAVANVTTGSASTLATGDYAIGNFGASFTAPKTFASHSTSAYNDYAVTNLSGINKTGITKLGTLTSAELNNSAPTISSSVTSSVTVSTADETGTTQDPKLVVEHAAGGSARRIINAN